ncbi:hypothetical protein BJX65DRAFT_268491 [Aspergillus insuetus]
MADFGEESLLLLMLIAYLRPNFRVFLIARWLADTEESDWASPSKSPYLFVAAILHDIGASDLYNGCQRFEVEGADVAKNHLLAHGVPPEDCHQVWVAIALHTSPGIAERISPLARLIRLAVKIDFRTTFRDEMNATDYSTEIEKCLPRLDTEKTLANAVVGQAQNIPAINDSLTWPNLEKHPSSSWPGVLLRAHIENQGYDGINPAF